MEMNIHEIKRISMLTHTDLDGFGCAQVAKYFCTVHQLEFNVITANNNEVDDKFDIWLDSINAEGTLGIISDLSLSEHCAEMFHRMRNDHPHMVSADGSSNRYCVNNMILCDHHKTTFENKYLEYEDLRFSELVHQDGKYKLPECGTTLVLNLLQLIFADRYPYVTDFAHHVRNWDTHVFTEFDDMDCRRLNKAFFIYGWPYMEQYVQRQFRQHRFVTDFAPHMSTPIDIAELKEVDKVVDIVDRIPDGILKEGQIIENAPPCIILSCEDSSLHSPLGRALSTRFPAHIIALVDVNKAKVSLRSAGDVDCTIIAKAYKGGGHVNAAGFYTTYQEIDRIMSFDRYIPD